METQLRLFMGEVAQLQEAAERNMALLRQVRGCGGVCGRVCVCVWGCVCMGGLGGGEVSKGGIAGIVWVYRFKAGRQEVVKCPRSDNVPYG